MSDVNLFVAYLKVRTVMKNLSMNETTLNPKILNDTMTSCTILNTTEAGYEFSCEELDGMFASLTLAFIYGPSLNVMATLLGPKTAGIIGIIWGAIMAISGILMGGEFGMFFSWSSFAMLLLALYLLAMLTPKRKDRKFLLFGMMKDLPAIIKMIFSLHTLVFALILPFCPLFLLLNRILGVLKPENKLIKSQSTFGELGEAFFEASPQLMLQCYIVFHSLSPSGSQWFSLITSGLTLCLPNIKRYVASRSEAFGPKSIVKNFAIFFPASMFRVLTLSILGVFFKGWSANIILFANIGMEVLLVLVHACQRKKKEKEWMLKQPLECFLLGWLTISNLGRGYYAATYRLVSSVFWTIVYTTILVYILFICNTDPENVEIMTDGINDPVVWSELALVKDINKLNILLVLTICLGWFSLIMDGVAATIRYYCCTTRNNETGEYETNFWEGSLFLEVFSYQRKQATENSLEREGEVTTFL